MYVRVIEGKEFKGDDIIEYFLSTGVGSTFRVPEVVMEVEVHYNKEISEGGKDEGRKGIGSAIRRRRANRGCINIKG